MAVTCTAPGVTAASVDFDRLSDRELQVCTAYLVGQISASTLTASQVLALAYAAGYAQLSDRELQMAQLYLLCLANGGS